MNRPISTKFHGVLDYLTIGTFVALPAVMGWSRPLGRAVRGVAAMKLGYTLFTNHELSPVRLLPMKAHLALDCVGGATLCALPFVMADEDDDDSAMVALVALGLFDIAAAPLTRTTPADQRQRRRRRRPARLGTDRPLTRGAAGRHDVQKAGLSGGT